MDEEEFLTKQQVIEKYKPMFTEWSLSKLIRERKIKIGLMSISPNKLNTISNNRFISITDDFIKSQEENSVLNERRDFHIV